MLEVAISTSEAASNNYAALKWSHRTAHTLHCPGTLDPSVPRGEARKIYPESWTRWPLAVYSKVPPLKVFLLFPFVPSNWPFCCRSCSGLSFPPLKKAPWWCGPTFVRGCRADVSHVHKARRPCKRSRGCRPAAIRAARPGRGSNDVPLHEGY